MRPATACGATFSRRLASAIWGALRRQVVVEQIYCRCLTGLSFGPPSARFVVNEALIDEIGSRTVLTVRASGGLLAGRG